MGDGMAEKQSLILKKALVGAERPYLIKLNRQTNTLDVFRKCDNKKLYDDFSIKRTCDLSAYTIFEIEQSFPCIFGGETTPTPCGIFHIEAKSEREYTSSYYPNYKQVKFFGYLVIFEEYFIHSDLYPVGESGPDIDKAISCNDKTTSGCIRISQKNLLWLIENVDIGTLAFL